jgi:hypothetical protein
MGRRPLLDLNAVQETVRSGDSERPVLGDGLVHLTKDCAPRGILTSAYNETWRLSGKIYRQMF